MEERRYSLWAPANPHRAARDRWGPVGGFQACSGAESGLGGLVVTTESGARLAWTDRVRGWRWGLLIKMMDDQVIII